MRNSLDRLLLGICLFAVAHAWGSDHYVNESNLTPLAPYTDWTTAATNIQDAIDAAAAGEVVWVTNGIYDAGGKTMAGDLTNRVALDKAVTVESVNGPFVTIIQGARDPVTANGPAAVRCAWLTNDAVLRGFTLRDGATRTYYSAALGNGGGVWCSSSNAAVANCVITGNTAYNSGAAAYQGKLNNCTISHNQPVGFPGAATTYNCDLNNCTVVANLSLGTSGGHLTNCIVYGNSNANYSGGTWYHCSSTPLPPGTGNISGDPQLFADGIHLTIASPCRNAGVGAPEGTDIDGVSWGNPPSIGCAEWRPAPLIAAPVFHLTYDPVGFSIAVPFAGQPPLTFTFMKDGLAIADDGHFDTSRPGVLSANWVRDTDVGGYQMILSNSFGTATSGVAQVVLHFVNAAAGAQPVAPYLNWATAARDIQDAIDSALPSEIVLITNGLYNQGLRAVPDSSANRVVIDKPVLVQSANGSASTTIQGAWDPAVTNGAASIRCAWLTNGAILAGFQLQGGSAAINGGGGVCGISTTGAVVANCALLGNSSVAGGGAYNAALINCVLAGNVARGSGGGGAAYCILRNCMVRANVCTSSGGGALNCSANNSVFIGNSAINFGGGAYYGSLVNCTLTGNQVGNTRDGNGGGVAYAWLTNCIVFGNYNLQGLNSLATASSNYYYCTFASSCTGPLPAGSGNLSIDPQLLQDEWHLSGGSPCRGAGLARAANGKDIDGQPWNNPPAIGCDEWLPAPVIGGPMQIKMAGPPPHVAFSGIGIAGQPPFDLFWVKDGSQVYNGSHFAWGSAGDLAISNFGPGDAGAYQLVASNSFGTATSIVAQVTVQCVNAAAVAPAPPYSSWQTAATDIQTAIESAAAGDYVLVTNGTYASGGRVMTGDLTNRVALTKPLTVISMNGPEATVIQGSWDPATTNGPLAARCAWLVDGSELIGFTLRDGATRSSGDSFVLQSGGGAWAGTTNAWLRDCVLTGNAANAGGGGCYAGSLERCRLVGNTSSSRGGGFFYSSLINCLVRSNSATMGGGGSEGNLINCTVVNNYARHSGGGIFSSAWPLVWNCIITGNSAWSPPSEVDLEANYGSFGLPMRFTCTRPLPGGAHNIDASPSLLDGIHPALNSPCRRAGDPAGSSGVDLDGHPWANPPSMGCFEVDESAATGPLSVKLVTDFPTAVQGKIYAMRVDISGWANRLEWWFGDGSFITNTSPLGVLHTYTNTGDYTAIVRAFNADNPGGVSTNLLVHVEPLLAPYVSAIGLNGSAFSLSFPGQPGVRYSLDRTTNLIPPVIWESISITYGSGGSNQLLDTTATNDANFYRIGAQ